MKKGFYSIQPHRIVLSIPHKNDPDKFLMEPLGKLQRPTQEYWDLMERLEPLLVVDRQSVYNLGRLVSIGLTKGSPGVWAGEILKAVRGTFPDRIDGWERYNPTMEAMLSEICK